MNSSVSVPKYFFLFLQVIHYLRPNCYFQVIFFLNPFQFFVQEIYADDSASWKKNKECAWGNEDVPSSGYPVETATKIPTDENCDKAQGIMMDKL